MLIINRLHIKRNRYAHTAARITVNILHVPPIHALPLTAWLSLGITNRTCPLTPDLVRPPGTTPTGELWPGFVYYTTHFGGIKIRRWYRIKT